MQVPMIWCPILEKNVAFEDLTIQTVWDDTEQHVKCGVQYFLGDKVVRADAHVYCKEGFSMVAEQPSL